MARSGTIHPRYHPPMLPAEVRKGMRVIDVRSGFIIYTDQAVPYRGGWTDARRGPRFDPRRNSSES